MLDNLYTDIGAKIKSWAKWIFIVEAISAIFVGFGLIADDDGLIGFVVLILGPLVAWVSSWLLYAFGELVEDVHAIRNKEGTQDAKIRRAVEEKVKQESEAKARYEAEEKAKQEQAKEQKEVLQKALTESGNENGFTGFVEAIFQCERISDVKKIWEEYSKDEGSALSQEIEKEISAAYQVERLYGVSNGSVAKLIDRIGEILTPAHD